ncbi:MAG: urea ABC transporter ATP-binding protein UrtD [Verrucomicrobia bacterium]|nr:urea ABC transporter ATP-binding protein UrtD [Verrucomicrobiota bacterium]
MRTTDSPAAAAATTAPELSGTVTRPVRLSSSSSSSRPAILALRDVTVSFDGFRALNSLSLDIYEGEIRCIIGPNGAGKTTMMDVITGKTKPTSGTIRLSPNLDLRRWSSPRIAQAGIGRKFQKPSVFENHTVWQNLELARKTGRRWYEDLFAPADQHGRVDAMLDRLGLAAERNRWAGAISHGQKQRLEIGMLLMQQPRLLLLDEPAAGLSDHDTAQLAQLLLSLGGDYSLVVVEHDMDFVAMMSGAERTVTVLAEGSVLAEGTLEDVKRNPTVIESYLGR